MTTMIRHGSSNIKKDLSAGAIQSDVNEMASKVDVWGLQEIETPAHTAALKALGNFEIYWPGGTPAKGRFPGWDNSVPIMWRKEMFTKLGSGKIQTHGGEGGVTPPRYVAWVILKHKATGATLVRVNTHFISSAWTSAPERKARWLKHEDLMVAKIHSLAKKYGHVVSGGDINRGGKYRFAGATMLYPDAPTYDGGAYYDTIWLNGTSSLGHGSVTRTELNSDHDGIAVPVALPAVKASVNDQETVPKPSTPAPTIPSTSRVLLPKRNKWRYIAQRLDGSGNGEFLSFELPLQDVQYTKTISGFDTISASVSPVFQRLLATDGLPILNQYGTAIYAENDGEIRAGGIFTDESFEGPKWNITATGFAGYSSDMPWVSSDANNYLGVEVDPLDVLRVIWAHIQSHPGGNIGLEIDPLKTGKKIGVELAQVEFDTQAGPVSFESGPVQLNWYTNHDLSSDINSLAEATPFDWREHHFWDGEEIRHRLELGYPRLGRQRPELRFVVGENVNTIPSVSRSSEDYASEVVTLGAGEGRKMIRGGASRPTGRLRRPKVIVDSGLGSLAAANNQAKREIAWRTDVLSITDIQVRNTASAPLGSVEPGDEILIQGRLGWLDIENWCRVLSITTSPETNETQTFSIVRSDRLSS